MNPLIFTAMIKGARFTGDTLQAAADVLHTRTRREISNNALYNNIDGTNSYLKGEWTCRV